MHAFGNSQSQSAISNGEKVKIILGMRKNHIGDSLNVLMIEAGLKGSKDSDPEMEDIEPTLGYDMPYEEPADSEQ